jgi:hypothetical protein
MKRSTLIALAALTSAATAAGCNGASSARETEASASTAIVPQAALSSTMAPTATTSSTTTAKPATPRDTVALAAPRAARGGPLPPPDANGIIEASFDDVRFPMKKTDAFVESMLTDRVKSLFGQRIRIRGYMYPTNRKRGLKEFVLVRDNMECCFGPGAALFDCILVSLDPNHPAEYSIRPVTVEGVFKFDTRQMAPDAPPIAIYRLDEAVVK